MFECRASYFLDNEWSFNIFQTGESEYRIYPAQDHRGQMMDLTRCNRQRMALIHTFDHWPTYDEVVEVTTEWTAVNYLDIYLGDLA